MMDIFHKPIFKNISLFINTYFIFIAIAIIVMIGIAILLYSILKKRNRGTKIESATNGKPARADDWTYGYATIDEYLDNPDGDAPEPPAKEEATAAVNHQPVKTDTNETDFQQAVLRQQGEMIEQQKEIIRQQGEMIEINRQIVKMLEGNKEQTGGFIDKEQDTQSEIPPQKTQSNTEQSIDDFIESFLELEGQGI